MLCRPVVHEAVSVKVIRPVRIRGEIAAAESRGARCAAAEVYHRKGALVPRHALNSELLVPALELGELLGSVVIAVYADRNDSEDLAA